jgi:hypothetical protein
MSNFGQSGQEIITATIIPLIHNHPGPLPHYGDPRLHPVTNGPIPNSRKYTRELPSEEETKDGNFDHDTLPLSSAGSAKFDHDLITHSRLLTKHLDEIDKRQLQDTNLLNFILQHCSSTVKDTVKTNALMKDFETNSAAPQAYHRGFEYLTILNNQFSKGNSTTTVTEVTNYFNMIQGADSTAIFLTKAQDQLDRITPLIQSSNPLYVGHVDIKRLQSMVLIKGLDKSQPANLRALEIHLQQHEGTLSLDHPDKLTETILQYQQSDLATLSLGGDTEQTSAFASTTSHKAPSVSSKPKSSSYKSSRLPGVKIPERNDHCPFCLSLSKGTKYFYHREDDCKQKLRSNTAAPSPTQANVAATTSLTSQAAFDFLQSQGYIFSDDISPSISDK